MINTKTVQGVSVMEDRIIELKPDFEFVSPRKRMCCLAGPAPPDTRTFEEKLNDKIEDAKTVVRHLEAIRDNKQDVCLECFGTGFIDSYCPECT